MGVKGLWRLLLPIGRRISIETLEGKILAIDASIWIAQFLTAQQDKETGHVPAAVHLIGFFRRLCRLRYHNIKPVVVFDGPMPEIKRWELQLRRRRRETFAKLGDAAVQRMARRMLEQNLLSSKQKSPTTDKQTNGAIAAGVNLQAQSQTNAVDDTKTPSNEQDVDGGGRTEGDGFSGGDEEPVEEGVNDWNQLQSHGDELLEGESDSENDWETPTNADAEVQYISSLPANKRKDAIESAKRRQRLQSRKEFMPAAADPLLFSSVQVRNFLKSSNLNKAIVNMATRAAQKDDAGMGEVMQSDRTRRVELIREDDGKLEQIRPLKKRRLITDSGSDSEDDVFGVYDGREPLKTTRPRVLEDGSSDDDDLKPAARPSPKGRSVDEHTPELGTASSELLPKRSGYAEEEGGFLRKSDIDRGDSAPFASFPVMDSSSTDKACVRTKVEAVLAQELEDQVLARALQSAEDEEAFHEAQERLDYQHVSVLPVAKETKDYELASPESHLMTTNQAATTAAPTGRLEPPSDSEGDLVDWEEGDETDSLKSISHVQSQQTGDQHRDVALSEDNGDSPPLDEGSSFDLARRDTWNEGATKQPPSSHSARNDARSAYSDETIKALERSQHTASNLANWAGAVFRRAMKEVNGGISSPSKSDDLRQVDANSVRIPRAAEVASRQDASSDEIEPVSPQPREDNHGKSNQVMAHSEPSQYLDYNRSLLQAVSDFDLPLGGDNLGDQEVGQRQNDLDIGAMTDELRGEIIQLLQLFGVPFIVAPAEAEAQCAALENLGLVHGIVTEDSDVFVFGGRIVYKNIFEEQKYAEVYSADDADREMGLGRNQMVALAMLLGGDYTEGVKGVGIVNAMETLEAFDMSQGVKAGLLDFRKWLHGLDLGSDLVNLHSTASGEKLREFKNKHKSARRRWTAPEGFPSDAVLQAYTNPVVDKSADKFSWGLPDVARLVAFCSQNFGWRDDDTKRLLDPVMQNLQSGLRQTRMDAFMKYEDSIKFADVKSKRLRTVLGLEDACDK